jgi:hypothetical protein
MSYEDSYKEYEKIVDENFKGFAYQGQTIEL